MSIFGWMRLSALTFLGEHPRAFIGVARFGSGRQTLVSAATGLCIEAPPRSGNSFFVAGFSMANPDVALAHHHHVPAQVLNAMNLGVPVVTLLRNPIDSALARAAPSDEPFMIGTTLARFVSFWDRLQSRLDEFPVVRFEDLVSNPAGAIEIVNETYGTMFSTKFPETSRVFAEMNRSRAEKVGPDINTTPNPNIPNERIASKEAVLRPHAEKHRLARRALKLYDRVLKCVSGPGTLD